jgi:hypothetical protein
VTVVVRSELPATSLLRKYAAPVGYADCYVAEVAGAVSHESFVRAFYTTALFGVERAILKWFASRPSTDEDVAALASGASDTFAAWRVEARSQDQLLLADYTGRTRSWLMVGRPQGGRTGSTLLYFGSAVVPRADKAAGKPSMGPQFNSLLGFHKLYSRALLRAARNRILASR